jgi:hypothetical protein
MRKVADGRPSGYTVPPLAGAGGAASTRLPASTGMIVSFVNCVSFMVYFLFFPDCREFILPS